MKIIDLSHTITPNMPVYPGTEQPIFIEANSIDQHGFAEKKLTFYSHTGTHIDAPAHIIENQPQLDELPLSSFFGQALCIPIDKPEIGAHHFEPFHEQLHHLDFILFATGWSKFWGKDQYFRDYPVLTAAAADFLCKYKLKGIGFDTISADREDSTDFPIHNTLLQHMIVIENLTNLELLDSQNFQFCCFPLKIVEADGSPVRAVALVNITGEKK